MSEMGASDPPRLPTVAASTGDLNLRIVKTLMDYLAVHQGDEAVDLVAGEAGIPVVELRRAQAWVSFEQFELILAAVRKRLSSDQEFLRACAFEMAKGYGPVLYVLRATSVRLMYSMLARTVGLVSKVSRYELVQSNRTSATLRYTSTKAESRLMCLSRQAQVRSMPTIWWGLRDAHLEEGGCISRGDPACVYKLAWVQPLGLRLTVVGGVAGGLIGALSIAFTHSVVAAISIAVIGLFGGSLASMRRLFAESLRFEQETLQAVEKILVEHGSAVQGLLALHERQEAWNEILEERIAQRTAALESVVSELRGLRERRISAIRGFSHDMRNPLTVLRVNLNMLQGEVAKDPNTRELVDDIDLAVSRLDDLLKGLMTVATAETDTYELRPERIDIPPLVDRLRRHLQALVIGRDIRVSVFRTRESPDAIEADEMLFNRVVDNLMSNAVKYTERGSIIVEVGGTPGRLCLKISDTGRGIAQDRLHNVFVLRQRDPKPMIGDSYGLGLANAVRLLDQIRGRLEVMSKPGVGTTFWVYFPIAPSTSMPPATSDDKLDGIESILKRVLTIRKAANE